MTAPFDGMPPDEFFGEAPSGPRPKVKPPSGRPPLSLVTGRETRPDVLLTANIHEVSARMAEVLRADPGLYQRSGKLVHVVEAEADLGCAAMVPGTPTVRHVPISLLRNMVSANARCLRFSAKSGKWGHAAPPNEQVASVLDQGSWTGIRRLVGLTEAPVLRPDGTVCQVKGYDAGSGYLYTGPTEYPEVAECPTQAQAREAMGDLLDVFLDFPYAKPEHAAVPIAAILTVLARPAINGAVPAFAFDAATRGSGKTLQCDVVSLITSGRTAARANYPEKDEELEKTLAAYATAGARLVLLDNVTRVLGCGPLDAVLTCRDDVEFRVLGRTEIQRLPWRAVVMMSGNNLTLGEDTTRRCLMARLESPLESPEERADFRHPDLIKWTLAERPRLVHAALTILRAYTAHGSPDVGCARWGSFEEWSALVPGAMMFAGGINPMVARATQSTALNDSKRTLSALIDGLNRLCPLDARNEVAPVTARAILSSLYPDRDTHEGPREPDRFDDLRDVIEQETNCPQGRKPEARKLGKWLQKVRGRVINGWCVERSEGANNTACWRAVMASG